MITIYELALTTSKTSVNGFSRSQWTSITYSKFLACQTVTTAGLATSAVLLEESIFANTCSGAYIQKRVLITAITLAQSCALKTARFACYAIVTADEFIRGTLQALRSRKFEPSWACFTFITAETGRTCWITLNTLLNYFVKVRSLWTISALSIS